MLIDTIFFLLGFIFLIKGADLLVDGSSSIAKKYGISNFVIGLTIVAFGTSMPELLVSTLASFKGSAGVALGNIIGSNISNTLLILGISAVIRPLLVKKNTVNKEIPFSLLAVLAVGFLVNDKIIDGFQSSILTRIDGFVLILFFVIFIYYTFGISKDESTILESISEEKIETYKFYHSAALIMAGLVGLYFGGEWIVGSAINFAKIFNISETLIGLTIIAVGTSLPELAASAVAAYRGKTDIAVGNVVGSNIFNILWVLGISSVIAPIPFSTILNVDFFILFAVTILLLFLIFVGKRNILGRVEGSFLIFLYIIYLIFIIFRG
ncbi:sodium:proton exchanger [Candidatus Falkowbacteria bacterium RIFOXYB2_FULL_34_18]|uniref:Sodium:proton exchanger n=1 Tax=Candidatus Falkowbacteria bacterium RIFOXYD2_FULL_34_120 TaxID=1798007 RepID=A0A1F5TMA4_9BACT|nr:MAG: sodium:proton exchanger [Candidatus Falkowbacteria bacterium RIFOXYB2_FULL_34_18]OGF29223.1 MAG: sodium:proton exchanger [Candidatus Falkowbacteria bacterium RIFOXYC12_FULL_34_55]OGF37761.1 MAG: sodium:proton exchanger [Candidatus Falkowbacteria bacterium RIFOXYC2_FULL_34_220]OGF38745.1 MAG: sodium:proton exchanger [Candidatus Falkowbacteria bacterium RIFOXYD12_FULL_34_57]OGF39979.1 MAG: sodium:proton exchanger [Candidatus Falkowbacteria bacterium RIFOXYD2_FULL_34_120]